MAKDYTVDDITERTMITRTGKVEKIYRVTATSKGGTQFTIEVPDSEFNEEKVAQLVTARAHLIDAIRRL